MFGMKIYNEIRSTLKMHYYSGKLATTDQYNRDYRKIIKLFFIIFYCDTDAL